MAGIILISIASILYFVPTLIAALRSHRWTAPIVVINLFAGWTLIGWVAALAMAACPTPPKVLASSTSGWAPGWYPTVDGETAYWDGTGWADPVLAN